MTNALKGLPTYQDLIQRRESLDYDVFASLQLLEVLLAKYGSDRTTLLLKLLHHDFIGQVGYGLIVAKDNA